MKIGLHYLLLIAILTLPMSGEVLAQEATYGEPSSVAASEAVLFVAPSVQGIGDCSSWADACTLQTALITATSDDEIWVKAGVYKPTDTADRTIAFSLDIGAAVFGGFAGTETSLDQRDWQANVTILSGDIDSNDVNTDNNFIAETPVDIQGNNSFHVLFTGPSAGGTVLDGFVITAGQANGTPYTDETRGGGIYNNDNNLWLENLVFSGNTASENGGGMYNKYTDYLWLINVTFTGNTAGYGGGGMHNRYSSPVLTGVTFSSNNAAQSGPGGGLDNQYSSSPKLTDVTFHNNSAGWGGGMSNQNNSHPELTKVTFNNNSATGSSGGIGGGLYNNQVSDPELTDVVFITNSASNGGGGMFNSESSAPILVNVVFDGNTVANWYGGGMYNTNYCDAELTNVLFLGNMVRAGGGGMYNESYSEPALTNVTFYGNRVTLSTGKGGGMFNTYSSYPWLTNVILWGDTAPGGSPEIYNSDGGSVDVAFSDIQGCGGSSSWVSNCGVNSGGNIDLDPLFLDAAGGNLRLQWDSPAIDDGDNTWVPSGILTDLDGNPRFVDIPTTPDNGFGTPPIVDMGAYEAQVNVAIETTASPLTVAPGEVITFTLAITNRGSITATQVIVTDTLPAFFTGISYAATLTVTDTGTLPPYVWSVQDLAPLQGGVITVSGVVTDPGAYGTYTNTALITANDDSWAGDNTSSATYTITLPNVPPTFISTPVTTATEDFLYTYAVTTEDANGDNLTITAPTLPGWLSLVEHGDGTATLSGIPTHAQIGEHQVVLRVTDTGELFAEQPFTITVSAGFNIYLPLVTYSQ